jgi:ABC-type cobalamin/Fe3+-siderophores transport system ATPase subunit
MANRPPVLLLDEPFGALDAQTRLRMHEWLRGLLADRPTTVVLVTHDVEEALLLGDRLALLSQRPARVVESTPVPFGPDRAGHAVRPPLRRPQGPGAGAGPRLLSAGRASQQPSVPSSRRRYFWARVVGVLGSSVRTST